MTREAASDEGANGSFRIQEERQYYSEEEKTNRLRREKRRKDRGFDTSSNSNDD
jgi:hypothetical protein